MIMFRSKYGLLFLPAFLLSLFSCTRENRADEFKAPEFLYAEAVSENGLIFLRAALTSGRADQCGFIMKDAAGNSSTYVCDVSGGRFEFQPEERYVYGKYSCEAFAKAGGSVIHSEPFPVMLPFREGQLVGKGVVYRTSEDGGTAMVLSTDELAWQPWDIAYEWCLNHGEGWAMPSIEELTSISRVFDKVNKTLGDNNLPKLCTENYCYWSSTPYEGDSDYFYRERLWDGLILCYGSDEYNLSEMNLTRAVRQVVNVN